MDRMIYFVVYDRENKEVFATRDEKLAIGFCHNHPFFHYKEEEYVYEDSFIYTE